MKKVFLNTLELEEVIKRLKNGEIVKHKNYKYIIKMIDNVIVLIDEEDVIIGDSLVIDNENDYYFEENESFKITETGLYKTRNGRKAFVFKIDKDVDDAYPVNYVIKNEDYTLSASKQGRNVADHETAMDIVAKWE